MEIRNLISFVQVAELNSFTKAAEALDYSQSTISFQIKQLEKEMDCLLFERINHTLILTDRGRELLEYAQRISRLTDEFRQNMTADREIQGQVHVLAPDSLCEAMMLDHYEDFYRRYPGIRLKFSTADTEDMFSMLNHNEADLMLTLDRHTYHRDYVIAHEEPVQMNFVAGTASPYATQKELSLFDIGKFPLILTENGLGYRHILDEEMAKKSIEILPILEIGRTDIITSMLEVGMGVSFLPEFVTRKKVAQGKLVYLNVTDMNADVWKQLIYHKNKWVTKAMHHLIEYIKENEFGK